MNVSIELYNDENGNFCAYIGDDCGSSGYEIVANSIEDRAEQIKEYFLDIEE